MTEKPAPLGMCGNQTCRRRLLAGGTASSPGYVAPELHPQDRPWPRRARPDSTVSGRQTPPARPYVRRPGSVRPPHVWPCCRPETTLARHPWQAHDGRARPRPPGGRTLGHYGSGERPSQATHPAPGRAGARPPTHRHPRYAPPDVAGADATGLRALSPGGPMPDRCAPRPNAPRLAPAAPRLGL